MIVSNICKYFKRALRFRPIIAIFVKLFLYGIIPERFHKQSLYERLSRIATIAPKHAQIYRTRNSFRRRKNHHGSRTHGSLIETIAILGICSGRRCRKTRTALGLQRQRRETDSRCQTCGRSLRRPDEKRCMDRRRFHCRYTHTTASRRTGTG